MDIKYAASIKPSERQVKWQELAFYGFIHFGMNTMNGVEWGEGNDDSGKFNPESLDADQWVEAMKASGMTGVLLTAKHHDGFCLWPSKYTDYTVASSPWKDGKGDVVAEVAEACRKHDMKFGVYLSPWDRHEPSYGRGKAYDDFFVNQMEELLTNYGDIFSVWFDGANGEGPNGKVQHYDWARYYETIRRLQPEAAITISGPDARWVGNEAGKARENEWSVVPAHMKDPAVTAGLSQQEDDDSFREQFQSSTQDLGSREALKDYDGELIWYPAEVDVSIRPGWFYHPEEDDQVRTVDNLFHIYKTSVGHNTTLLLNVPPMPNGLLHENDVAALAGLGEKVQELYEMNLLETGKLIFSSNPNETTLDDLMNFSLDSPYWSAASTDEKPWLAVEWGEPQKVNTLIIGEQIKEGQLLEQTEIEMKMQGGDWTKLTEVHSVGYRRIIEFDAQEIVGLRVHFTETRSVPNVSNLSITLMEESNE